MRNLRVVGVVRDHKHLSLREPSARFVYVPLWQPLDRIARITLAVASDQPASLAIAQEVRAVHPRTLVSDVIGVEEQIDATLVSERLLPALATVGLFGVLGYAVTRRRSEIAVRIALGAPPARIAANVLRQGLLQVAGGLAIGLPIALVLARAAEGLLFGVRAMDPAHYLLGAAVLGVVAALAAWLPARRAASVDPAETLRLTI
jgi:hypothetical protein